MGIHPLSQHDQRRFYNGKQSLVHNNSQRTALAGILLFSLLFWFKKWLVKRLMPEQDESGLLLFWTGMPTAYYQGCIST
ncbi:MAG: hypothetical protein KZQ77_04515, partial [Candidatus Thiodiazotropha sp. (ex Notomyrtea botanica)]|nr:hypothetical protein [Candidatus Thiodiazotropha sp. (ex Notomyrtea botanica)]